MSEGFSGYPEWKRDVTADLTVDLAIETFSRPDYDVGIMKTEDAGRRRIVIEGKTEYVDALYQALQPALETARAEIGD